MGKNVLITGATGLIGKQIVKALLNRGDNITAITTNTNSAAKTLPGVNKFVHWDNIFSLSGDKIDVIINLAGKNMGEKRWNEVFKKEAWDSRILSTRKVVELVSKMPEKPEVLLSASGSDYYGDRGEEDITEESPPGDDFMAKLCIAWEAEALKAEGYGVRTAVLRTGFVIARNSDAVKRLVLPFKLFVGGPIGKGSQFMSWIHIDDVVGIYLYAADNKNVSGPVNATAPNPVTMKNFCKSLAKTIHRPSFFRALPFIVKAVAGEVSQAVLNGRKAYPKKITAAGYKFKFDNVSDAWKDVL
jgi:uncharacterized protein